MAENLEEGISDDLLEKASADIQKLLKRRGLPEQDRVQLEVQSYFLMFLISDHKKIGQIYPFFRDEKQRQEKNKIWWEKMMWILIPAALAALVAFMGQFIYFWLTVVPNLQSAIK